MTASTAAEPRLDHFRQLDDVWPTPNNIRRPSGAPGNDYWQQKVDYDIDVEIDDERQILSGSEKITYHNNSPDALSVLWLQLDQNRYERTSDDWLSTDSPDLKQLSYDGLREILYREQFDGGFRIASVSNESGAPLQYSIVRTMMRVHLAKPLRSGKSTALSIVWRFKIPDGKAMRVRGGFEYFEKDGNYLYNIAQWYPRLCAYTDYQGWQNRQTLGAEFALEFGDFHVNITAPNDHIVASTGELQNAEEVLTKVQRERLAKAAKSERPVYIVTQEEATKNELSKPSTKKTWKFAAENVRDFAFASSRKFIWDAQGVDVGGRTVMAMSYWPKEGQPLWGQYSTAAVVHTIRTYSKFTFDYPYPIIISVNGPIPGMEYPMITFQDPRPEDDGTYSEQTKNGLISVIIHEVGHSWFPMIVNSDERRWRWMDEGLNSFVQFLAEQEWEASYPSRPIRPDGKRSMQEYMKRTDVRPIMSDADNLIFGGHNAYGKPTLALTILRESILGRDQFDFAFKEYANRWKFKRPTPFDFFRTMEESSGHDLDWFWRGWFYSTDHVDVAIEKVRKFRLDSQNPEIEKQHQREVRATATQSLTEQRNKDLPKRVEQSSELNDFYTDFDDLAVLPDDRDAYRTLLAGLKPDEQELLQTKGNFYVVDFKNIGGVVMPLVIEIEYADDSKSTMRMPAAVWRLNGERISKLIFTQKEIASITVDPLDEMADTDRNNNRFPRLPIEESFQLQKPKKKKNPMQQLKKQDASENEESSPESK
ncbi:MAG: M1 family metallopeptidase [Planctomycetales bacterium]|nr:M1 family metallopeptidase [Planctomycetales bacterium]